MTGVEKLTGATPYLGKHWKSVNWKKVQSEVRRLQMRIAKAVSPPAFRKTEVFRGLSRMMGNYLVRFLGGNGGESPPLYPEF